MLGKSFRVKAQNWKFISIPSRSIPMKNERKKERKSNKLKAKKENNNNKTKRKKKKNWRKTFYFRNVDRGQFRILLFYLTFFFFRPRHMVNRLYNMHFNFISFGLLLWFTLCSSSVIVKEKHLLFSIISLSCSPQMTQAKEKDEKRVSNE